MKKSLLAIFSTLFISFLFPASVYATVLYSESFDGKTVGRLAKSGADWGSGTNLPKDGLWHTTANLNETYIQVVSQQLTKAGYCSNESGKAVKYSGNHGRDYVGFSDDYTLKPGDKIYMAFLLKVNTLTSNTGSQIIAGLANSITTNTVGYIYNQVKIKRVDASSYNLAIGKKNETEQVATDVALSTGTTYLVVTEYIVKDGVYSTASDQSTVDSVNLYINPTKASKKVTKSAKVDLSTSRTDALSFVGVALCTTSNSPTDMVIDELKVTTSWDELWEEGGDTPPQPVVPAPSPVASSITVNSATISWDEVENADSYVLQWKKKGTSYGEEIAIDKDVRSYDLSNLVENTQYYVQVKTVIGANSGDFAEIDFTTTAEPAFITYQGITFTKYDVTNDLPSFGERFIARNIVFSTDVNITGDLKLCLNGYSIFTHIHRIIVKNGATLTIYNNKGDGQILGGVVAPSWLDLGGVIKVEDGGTLIIREGAIENIADDEDGSYAVNNFGTLVISGAPSLIGNSASIYLASGKMITLEEGKPLTNTTPYSVNSPGQLFTSGWSACMGDATPSTYFSSAKSGFSKVLAGKNELYLVHSGTLSLSENNDNASIIGGAVGGSTDDILMDRVFTDTQYNTICLPFALTNGQLEQIFGSGYDLQEFSYSELDGDVLNLHFNARTDLEAGKPYLIWPTQEVEDILRNGADITAAEPVDQISDTYISFYGTYAPTELEGGNKNLLFLGAGNKLFWPESTGNLKGFRAYFEVKGAAQKAAKRARIVKKEDSATGIDQITNDTSPMTNKIIKDGQLLILRDNKTYNVIGQMVK